MIGRRHLLAATLASPLAACRRSPPPPAWGGGWVGAAHERGHALRQPVPDFSAATVQRRASVLVLGGGVAGLAAARGFLRAGVDDLRVLDLEDQVGGNSRGHVMAGMPCPLGAHYLPQPGEPAVEWPSRMLAATLAMPGPRSSANTSTPRARASERRCRTSVPFPACLTILDTASVTTSARRAATSRWSRRPPPPR